MLLWVEDIVLLFVFSSIYYCISELFIRHLTMIDLFNFKNLEQREREIKTEIEF